MTVWSQVLGGVCGGLVLAMVLQGCATSEWVHPTPPPADLVADRAACEAQLAQETQGVQRPSMSRSPSGCTRFDAAWSAKGGCLPTGSAPPPNQ